MGDICEKQYNKKQKSPYPEKNNIYRYYIDSFAFNLFYLHSNIPSASHDISDSTGKG